MTTPARDLSVTVPFGQALERVKTVLFQPFDIGRWFIIGFCAWLAYLGEGGFHGGFGGGSHGGRGQNLRGEYDQARDYMVNNLGWILPLGIVLVLLVLAIWLVVLWLSSRGRFMFLHCVALNTAEVVAPWRTYEKEANSLFLFRIVLGLAGLVLFLPVLGGFVVAILRMAIHERATFAGVVAALALFAGLLVVSVLLWVVGRLLKDFVIPIQYLHRNRCAAAWQEFFGLIRGNLGTLILYLLFRIALAFGIALAVICVVVATCCLAGCLFALPYLGTVLLLPVYVLERSYSLHFLAQFGPGYDVFQPAGTTGLG